MVGVGEGYHQEERSVLILAARQPRAGLIGDVGCGIILLRHLGPDRLRHGVVVGELVIPAAQLEHVWRDPPQPLFVVSAGVGAVAQHTVVVVEAVERAGGAGVLVLPVARALVLEFCRVQVRADRVPELWRWWGEALTQRLAFVLGREIADVLQVALPDQRRVVARSPHDLDEGHLIHVQRDPQRAHAMAGRHAAGHQAGPVWHAHGRGDIEPLEPHPFGRHRVDMGSAEARVPVAAQIVHALLVRDEQDVARTLGRHRLDFPLSRQAR